MASSFAGVERSAATLRLCVVVVAVVGSVQLSDRRRASTTMFRVVVGSKDSYDIGSDAIPYGMPDGRYRRLNDEEVHSDHPRLILVAPELSQVNRVQILDFPSSPAADDASNIIRPGQTVAFRVCKHGARGIVTVHAIAPSSAATAATNKQQQQQLKRTRCDVIELSTELCAAHVPVTEAGVYRVHVRFNDVEVPRSPLEFRSVV